MEDKLKMDTLQKLNTTQ